MVTQDVLEKLFANKFMVTCLEALERTQGMITSPWMALGEQIISSARVASNDIGLVRVGSFREQSKMEVARHILAAQVFYWTDSVFAAIKECPMPRHVISDTLSPFPICYHTFQKRYEYPPEQIALMRRAFPDAADDSAYEWFLTLASGAGLDVYIFVSSMKNPKNSFLIGQTVRFGSNYPDDFGPREARDTGCFLAMMAFLKSPDKHIEHRGVPRSIRRSVPAKDQQPFNDKQVNVVTLRRTVHDRAEDTGEAGMRDWKHQWWVTGHMRAQWHPSKQSHELIWIAPHLKGPEDKPVLRKVYNVARE